jgi:hypothetical protein
MLHWSDVPLDHGRIYHKRGGCRLGADALVVDVFMPSSTAKKRPIAITIGRYRHDKPMRTEHWQLSGIDDLATVARELPTLLGKVGVRPPLVASLATEVEHWLNQESATITHVLSSGGC